jgi:dienelactone hydrolase
MRRLFLATFVLLSLFLLKIGPPAHAQTPVPVQTFKSSYSGLNPWVEWETWLTQAQKCTESQPIYGAQPSAAGKYPVVVYLHGTLSDWGGNPDGQKFAQLAAGQGFVAAAITYDSSMTLNTPDDQDHAYCMFNQSHSGNPLNTICAMAKADCSKGILVTGFSQGGDIAVMSKNYNSNVQAVWGIGTSENTAPFVAPPAGIRALPNNKLRINIGQNDSFIYPNGFNPTNQIAMTGDNCGTSFQCLQADGSGYYIVQNSEVADGNADHCYWMSVNTSTDSCTLTITNFDPGFQPPATTSWSMITTLNWLRSQLKP